MKTISSNTAAPVLVQLSVASQGTAAFGEIAHQRTTFRHGFNEPGTTQSLIQCRFDTVIKAGLQGLMLSAQPVCQVRLGLGTARESQWLPWQSHLITSFSALPTGKGQHTVKIETADALWKLNRVTKIATRTGAISEMVAAIAAENGLEAKVEDTTGHYTLTQARLTDYQFIVNRCLARAASKTGRGNYRLYVKDNVLHFHSADYDTELYELRYFGQTPTLSLVQTDYSQLSIETGGGLVKLTTHDPLTGEMQEAVSDASAVLVLGNTMADLPAMGMEYNMSYAVGSNGVAEALAIMQNRYEQQRTGLYELKLTAKKLLWPRLNDFVNIIFADTSYSAWSGQYNVAAVTQVVDQGDLTCQYSLRRGELNLAPVSQTILAANDPGIVLPSHPAQGQQPNFQSKLSSGTEVLSPG